MISGYFDALVSIGRVVRMLRDARRANTLPPPEYAEMLGEIVSDPDHAARVIDVLAGVLGGTVDKVAEMSRQDPDEVLDGMLDRLLMFTVDLDGRET